MALTERLAILIDADGAKAVSEFSKVGAAANRSLGAAESSAAKLGYQLQTAGATATGVGAALTVGLTKAAGKFSDLEQATGAAEAVFGSAVGSIEKFGETSATSIGLSEAAFKQLTSTVGALLQGFGFTQAEAAKTSISVAKLGADLSAAFGGTTQQAIEAIGAALRGETDPIERYGAAFNQAAVDTKILELGLDTSTAAAKANAKATASLAIIFERTANVQGQFAREVGSVAHEQQVAAASAENAAAQLGEGFAPVLLKVTELTTDAAEAFTVLDDATGGLASTVAAVGAVALDVAGPLTVFVGLALQARAARAAEAAAAATSAAASAASAAATGAETAAKAAAITVIHGFTAAETAAAGSATAATVAIGSETVAIGALGVGASTAAIEVSALAAANTAAGTSAAGAAAGLGAIGLAVGGVALVGGAIFGAAKAVDHFLPKSKDLDAELHKLSTTTDDELIPAFENLGIAVALPAARNDAFKTLAEQNIRTAARLRNEFKQAGHDTTDFDKILADLGFTASATSTPVGRLASDFKNYPPVLSAALEGIRGFGGGLVALASQIDSIGKSFEPRFAKLDLDAQFNAVVTAQQKAGGAARDLVADRRALEQATKSVTDAERELADAELALFFARLGPSDREKTDAELEKADAQLQLKEAYEDVRTAQERLNKARKDGDAEGFRDATLDLERANIGLRKAQLANEDAQKAYNDVLNSGAESSDEVKEANERLQQAQERLEEAQYQAEQQQRRLTEGTAAGTAAISDQGAAAEAVARQYEPYIQSLIDAGASTDDIIAATDDAIRKVGELETKYGDLNPKLKVYKDLLQEILATELLSKLSAGNQLSRAEMDAVLKSGVIVPETPPNVYEPAPLMAAGYSTSSTSTPIQLVMPDGRVIAEATIDYANTVGGIPLRVKSPN